MITDPLDRLLEARASFTDMAPPSAALDSALEDMAVQIKRTPYRRRRHRALVAAAISGSLVLAAPAAANWVSARTGWFGSPGMTENDTSEYLRQDSPEMAAIVESHGRDYPLPPGGSYAGVVERLRASTGGRGPELIQDTGVRTMVAQESVCQWQALWLSADDAGETDRRYRAGIVLEEAAAWPIFAQVDGGGVVELRRRVGAAATEGTRAPVEQDFRANCAGRDSQAGR
jgi:hypothetical protein